MNYVVKGEISNATKLLFAPFSSKAGNDINRVQTVSDRKIFALSYEIFLFLYNKGKIVCFYHVIYAIEFFPDRDCP